MAMASFYLKSIKVFIGTFGLLVVAILIDWVSTPSHCDQTNTQRVLHAVSAGLSTELEDRLYLNIPFKSLQVIKSDRDEALKLGVLLQPKFVKANINYNGNDANVQIRLKGDYLDHLQKMPWSYRVQLSSGHFKGMKSFSLQKPAVRAGMVEAIYMAEARKLGLIAPRYGFVHLYINGKDNGIVAYEEHMGKEILESNSRKEAPILAFNDEDQWIYLANNRNRNEVNPFQNMNVAPSKYFYAKKIDKKNNQRIQANFALNQIEDFQNGVKGFADVFDVEKMYLAMVLSDAWGSAHAISWSNIKFYMNPFTLKLEPILFDNGHQPEISEKSYNINNIYSTIGMELGKYNDANMLNKAINKVKQIDEAWYREELSKYENSSDLDSTRCLKFDYKNILQNKRMMQTSPDYYKHDSGSSQNFINSKFYENSINRIQERNFHKYVESSLDEKFILKLKNYIPEELKWENIKIFCSGQVHEVPLNKRVPKTELMFGMGAANQSLATEIRQCGLNNIDDISVTVNYRDVSIVSHVDLRRARIGVINNPLEPNLSEIPAFIRKTANGYLIPSGSWRIEKAIVFPYKANLTIEEGTLISFEHDAGLIINGAISINGTEKRPVQFQSKSNKPWSGVYVYKAGAKSKIHHLKINNIDVSSNLLLSLTGAITFYESDVELYDVEVRKVWSEDALNLVRSNFDIINLSIDNTHSDAVDSDFSIGKISYSKFKDIGGDAIDTSGTIIDAKNISILSVKDKAFSIGEKSNAVIENAEVKSVGTVVAVKDSSYAAISKVAITEPVGNMYLVYNKKQEYGPSKIDLAANDDVKLKSFAQVGNVLMLNKVKLPAIHIDVENMYSTSSMRKSKAN